jgi:hypothetical protein
MQFGFGSNQKANRLISEPIEIHSTTAGHSLKTIKETPSTMLNDLNQNIRELSQNVSQTFNPRADRMSLPRIKLVQVSPNLSTLRQLKGIQSARNLKLMPQFMKPDLGVGNL